MTRPLRNPAEVYECPRCPWRYESPIVLSEPPVHPCPTMTSSRRRPARKVSP